MIVVVVVGGGVLDDNTVTSIHTDATVKDLYKVVTLWLVAVNMLSVGAVTRIESKS